MRTKNELYQEAMRTVAARRQMARARAEDARAEAEAAIPALRHAEDPIALALRMQREAEESGLIVPHHVGRSGTRHLSH